jgi:diguanylate cyclase (GGDEF)-like protein/PAS domain S-box-containing protein
LIEEVYRTILEQMEDGVYFVDRDRRITYWNAGAERITGYSADDVLLHSCSEGILRHVSEGGYQLCLHGCPLSGVMKDGKAREAQVYLHHKQGHRVPVSVKGSPIRDEGGNIIGSVEVFHRRPSTRFAQVSERERQEDAYVDPLTDLGNRRFGEGHLEPLVAAVGAGAATLGLVFIDVDHFKQVNDTYGHKVGDAVLRMVGQTLANALRNTDWPVRWGGEEFLTILPGVTEEGLAVTAERLRMLVEHSWLQMADEQVRVTISAGAVMLRPGETAEDALDRADKLMYRSKAGGRNVVTTEDGPLQRSGQMPLVGTARPWEMVDPEVDRRSS